MILPLIFIHRRAKRKRKVSFFKVDQEMSLPYRLQCESTGITCIFLIPRCRRQRILLVVAAVAWRQ